MTLANPNAPALPSGLLGSATPERILYEAEEPVVFTLRSAQGQLLLAYLADASASSRWLLLVPCGQATLSALEQGRLPVLDALQSSWAWLAQVDEDDEWQGVWVVDWSKFPVAHLPKPGVLLLPEHERVRLADTSA